MLGIIIATHGTLSDGLKNAGEVIMGQTERIETINLVSGQAVESIKDEVMDKIDALGTDDGIVILTDVAGASPYNQSLLALHELDDAKRRQLRVLYGVNLPMLLSTMNQQFLNQPLDQAVATILTETATSMGQWEMNSADNEDDDDF
ncbi:MAG: PTS sugar transporter subunit IIA [Aerococcus sp.]|nr:PTS sugar transporter subunit IIA [Aerococcus sp.]